MSDVIVCFSRCLHCGRRTPHQLCHDCSDDMHAGQRFTRAEWGSYDDDPEICADEECRQRESD